jgi:peptide/nickel transport system substrate-binding protein
VHVRRRPSPWRRRAGIRDQPGRASARRRLDAGPRDFTPTSFDPITTSWDNDIRAIQHVFDTLTRPSRDGNGVEPDLAESWEVSPDSRVFTYHLRPNLEFSNGSPLRATDVKFSLDRVRKDPKSTWATVYPPFEVETPDDRTVILRSERAWPSGLEDLSFYIASILPEAHFSTVGRQQFNRAPIGSGPFVLGEIRPGDRSILRRNPRHWDARYPHLDEVHVLAITDPMTRMLKLQAGEVDVAEEVPFNQVETLEKTPNVNVQVTKALRMDWLYLNPRSPVLADVRVRQAIDLAIDRQAIIKTVLFGHGEVPASIMPGTLYTNAVDPPHRQDLTRAKQLLSESAHPRGSKIRVILQANPPHWVQAALMLKSQLESLGFLVEIEQVEAAIWHQRREGGEYEMLFIWAMSETFDPAGAIEWSFVSTSFFPKELHYANPRVDALAAQAKVETSTARRAELYLELQRIIREEALFVPLYLVRDRTGVRADVHGFGLRPTTSYQAWEAWKSP